MLLRFVHLLFIIAILATLSGCASQDLKSADTGDSQFRDTLSVCRFQHTGRTNQRIALKATEEHVAKCLARRGWSPSGEPLPPSRKEP
jgi:hypothetical protein